MGRYKTTANIVYGEPGPKHASARQKHVPLTEGQVDSSAQSFSLLTADTNLGQQQLDLKGESGQKSFSYNYNLLWQWHPSLINGVFGVDFSGSGGNLNDIT